VVAMIDWTFNLATLITAMVSIFALFLGIYNAYTHWKDRQPSISVKLSNGEIQFSRNDHEEAIFIDAYNNGQLPITIEKYILFLPEYRLYFEFHGMYKSKVLPGSDYHRWVPLEIFAEYLKRCDWFSYLKQKGFTSDDTVPEILKLEVQLVDSGERIYKSRPTNIYMPSSYSKPISEELVRSLINMTYWRPPDLERGIHKWWYKLRRSLRYNS
jgi:hypothetical protein